MPGRTLTTSRSSRPRSRRSPARRRSPPAPPRPRGGRSRCRCRAGRRSSRAGHHLGRLGRLAEEEPVPPLAREASAHPLEGLDDGYRAPEGGQRRDPLRVVHRGAKGGVAPAVVPGQREALVAEGVHERHDIGAHRALGGLRVLGGIRWHGGAAVAAQVGADDRVAVDQQRGDAMPGCVRERVAVQQDDGRAGPAVAHPQGHRAALDTLQREALEEHAPRHTRARRSAPAGPAD
jgi:hypothetical protein